MEQSSWNNLMEVSYLIGLYGIADVMECQIYMK